MTAVTGWLRGRVDSSTATLGLLVGDLAVIALFVAIGAPHHGLDLVGDFWHVLNTYSQFAIGWVVVALPAGVYAADLRADPKWTALTVAVAWVLAVAVAQLLRSTPPFHGTAALTFALVSIGVTGPLLLGWRVGAAVLTARRRSTVPA